MICAIQFLQIQTQSQSHLLVLLALIVEFRIADDGKRRLRIPIKGIIHVMRRRNGRTTLGLWRPGLSTLYDDDDDDDFPN
jgi:hypothetical protein